MKNLMLFLLILFVFSHANAQKTQKNLSVEYKAKYDFDSATIIRLNKLKIGSVGGMPTRYKPGFQYYDKTGLKITLLKWVPVGNYRGVTTYRWWCSAAIAGLSQNIYTDDQWIDLYTEKAFLNERTHQIMYYDSVDIIKKTQ